MLSVRTLVLAAVVLAVAGRAEARVQSKGPEVFPGPNEISIHFPGLGFDLAGDTPSGLRFEFDYGRRLREKLWLDVGFATSFGGSCVGYHGALAGCSFNGDGDSFEPFAGIKIKFPTGIPLVPYFKADGVLMMIFNRACGDGGIAPVGRVGGGAKYFLTRNIGVGVEATMTLGPAFLGSNDCVDYKSGNHTEFIFTNEFSAGAEFIF